MPDKRIGDSKALPEPLMVRCRRSWHNQGVTELRLQLASAPLPVAQVLVRAFTGKSPLERHNAAFYGMEACIKLSAAARISAWMVDDSEREDRVSKAVAALERGSLGQWVGAFRRTRAALDGPLGPTSPPSLSAAGALAELLVRLEVAPPDAAREVKRRGIEGLFGVAVAYRNAVVGHGSQREDAFYEAVEEAWLAAVFELIGTPGFLGGGILALAGDRWLDLRGTTPMPMDPPSDGAPPGPALVFPERTLSLEPLVTYDEDPTLERSRVGFLNRVKRSRGSGRRVTRVDYLDYASGATLRAVRADAVQAFFARVHPGEASGSADEAVGEASGSRLGPYRLDEELGRGGMGVVYAAQHVDMGSRVALKALSEVLATDPAARTRFQREIRALSRCDHANVVTVIDADATGDRPFYAMEFIDGADLSEPLGTLTPASLATMLAGAADGLQALHEQGVVHRDIKPANLMLTRDQSRIVVMDLGLARLAEVSRGLTSTEGGLLGTLRYMPPEQLDGDGALDGRADVYALGATLFELLAERALIDGDSQEQLVKGIVSEHRARIRDVDPALPVALDAIVAMATHPNPDRRYPDAAAFAKDLRAFADGAPIVARPPTRMEQLRFRMRGRWPFASLVAAVAVGLLGAGVWSWDRQRTKVSLHADLVWQNGVPTGVGTPAENAVQTWRVTRRGGRIVQVDHLTGRDAPLALRYEQIDLRKNWGIDGVDWEHLVLPCIQDTFHVFHLERCGAHNSANANEPGVSLRVRYDADGRPEAIEVLNAEGHRQVERRIHWTEGGYRMERLDNWGLAPFSARGAPYAEYVLDERGFIGEEYGRHRDGSPFADARGRHGYRYTRDAAGRVVERLHLDAEGQLLVTELASRDRMTRDAAGRVVERRGFDGQGDPAWFEAGCAVRTFAYSDTGELIASHCADVDGSALPDPGGCTSRTLSWDEPGFRQDCRDASGALTPTSTGWTSVVVGLGPTGWPEEVRFLDADEELVHVMFEGQLETGDDARKQMVGPATLRATRDPRGRLLGVSWFGVDGAMRSDLGWSGWRVERDDRGRIAQWFLLDAQGQPRNTREGIARAEMSWNDGDQVAEVRVYDEKGAPTTGTWGYHIDRNAYRLGRTYEWRFLGVDGEPVSRASDGVHQTKLETDELGRPVEYSHWGTRGEPFTLLDGYHARRQEYDEAGRSVAHVFLDSQRQPTIGPENCHRHEWGFDATGLPEFSRCIGPDGELAMMRRQMAATIEYGYENGHRTRYIMRDEAGELVVDHHVENDDRGLEIGTKSFYRDTFLGTRIERNARGFQIAWWNVDEHGKLVEPNGFAGATQERDERGNELVRAYFDAERRPVAEPTTGVHRFEFTYDAQNRVIDQMNFGVDGEQVAERKQGIVHQRRTYDALGHLVRAENFPAPGQTLGPHSFPRADYLFDERGLSVGSDVRNHDGALIDATAAHPTSPMASLRTERDDLGRLTEARFRLADGSPAPCEAGFSDVRLTWDDGARTLEIGFLLGDQPVVLRPGFRWDWYGREAIRDRLFDVKPLRTKTGHPPLHLDGVAGFVLQLDVFGRIVEVGLLDPDGIRTTLDGVAGYKQAWDARGYATGLTWIDDEGAEVLHHQRGWSSARVSHDAVGSVVGRTCFEPAGEEVDCDD